jgi:uracil-DNA glycosylase
MASSRQRVHNGLLPSGQAIGGQRRLRCYTSRMAIVPARRGRLARISSTQLSAGDGLWPSDGAVFDRTCTDCPRLAAFLEQGRAEHPDYYCAPVAPFGDSQARLLIIGLAPGFHGANASGRPFTGDHAGLLLYRTLHRFGFASREESSHRHDGLELLDCRITNSVKCVPPENKPTPAEIHTCNRYLAAELARTSARVLLALGTIAHNATLRALALKPAKFRFAHGAEHTLSTGQVLLDSYHCSRYNTQTGRLTEAMFGQVFARAAAILRGEQRTADGGR